MLISDIFEDHLPGGREENLERLEYINNNMSNILIRYAG
jgi:hypothetical protein